MTSNLLHPRTDIMDRDAAHYGYPRPRGLRVVTVGRGKGLYNILRGLNPFVDVKLTDSRHGGWRKQHISDLTVILGTAASRGADGGPCAFQMNEVCNCLTAFMEKDEALTRAIVHRFRTGEELAGYNLGNIILAALIEMAGCFAEAIRLTAELLPVCARILPVTTADSMLIARMDNGSIMRGKREIVESRRRIAEVMLDPGNAPAAADVIAAIAVADVVILGPGSLHTSVIPILLVKGVSEAIASTAATRIYIANTMSQINESVSRTASGDIELIYKNAGRPIFDCALVNTMPVPELVRKRYAADGAEPVIADTERIEALGIHCVTGKFAEEGNMLHHSPKAIADALFALVGNRSKMELRTCTVRSVPPADCQDVNLSVVG